VTAHTRVATRIHASLQQVGVAIAPTLINDALADVPTFELAAVLAERWAVSPSQHAFIRIPGEAEPEPTSGFTIVERTDDGGIYRTLLSPFADWREAKREAIFLNRQRPESSRWWVVADGAGKPLVPQP